MSATAATCPSATSRMDTLRGVLAGEILVHNHCYRADEMAIMIDMAQGVRLQDRAPSTTRSRAYKIADLLARERHLLGDVGRLVRLQDGKL